MPGERGREPVFSQASYNQIQNCFVFKNNVHTHNTLTQRKSFLHYLIQNMLVK